MFSGPSITKSRTSSESFYLKLGGVAAAELAHHSFGLPSIETTCRHIATEPLIASPKMPTHPEMAENLSHTFPSSTSSSSIAHCKGGFQIMVDEIKCEEHM